MFVKSVASAFARASSIWRINKYKGFLVVSILAEHTVTVSLHKCDPVGQVMKQVDALCECFWVPSRRNTTTILSNPYEAGPVRHNAAAKRSVFYDGLECSVKRTFWFMRKKLQNAIAANLETEDPRAQFFIVW